MADLSVMGFLNEETQQETEYNLKDAQARSDISTINGKIPSAASSSNKLVDTTAMNDAIGQAVSAAYKPAGNKTVAELTSSLLVAANIGKVYNMTDSGTTTADFVEGAGHPIRVGDDIGICEPTTGTFKFNILSGFIAVDTNPTQGSANPVSSGGVYSEFAGIKDGQSIDSFGDVETALADKVDKVTGKGLSKNDYTDADKAIVTTAQDNIKANTKLIRDSIGFSGKNKAKNYNISRTINNVDFTKNANESITINTPSVTSTLVEYTYDNMLHTNLLKVSELPSELMLSGADDETNSYGVEAIYRTSENTYISDERVYNGEKKLTIPANAYYIRLAVFVNANKTVTNKTVYPMLRDANILDSTYEPFHESVDEVKADKSDVNDKFTASVTLLDDTVGFVGKNKNYHNAQTSTAGTVTFTVNANKSVGLSGTTTTAVIKDLRTYTGAELKALGGKLVLSGGDEKAYLAIRTSNYTFIARSFGDAVEFDTSTLEDATTYYETIGVIVPSGGSVDLTGVVIFPMITDPDVYSLSPTYRPYHESVEDWYWNNNAKTGVHQYLTYPYVDTTKTVTDITFTDVGDGTIKINGNKSTSVNEVFRLFMRDSSTGQPQLILPAGNYKLCKDITTSGISMTVAYTSGGSGVVLATLTDSSKEVEFTVTDSMGKLTVQVNVSTGNYSDVIIKPLLKLAEDTSNLVTPYAMTNRELTEKVQEINSSVSLLNSPAEVGNTGMITIPISDIMQYSDIVVVGYNESDSGGNRFVAVIPTEIDGQFDVGIPFVVKSSTGVGFIVARIASNALSLTFLDNANTNITTMYVKKIYGRKR